MLAWIAIFGVIVVASVAIFLVFTQYQKTVREAKNYERGLKMIPMRIHLPPPSDDIENNSRDERDVVDETLSQAQVMYNIISSTALKGFKTKIYGQRHISFEIIANEGLIYYYAVVPAVITETIKQAIAAAYPTARLEEVEPENIFSRQGKNNGVIGGEFSLKKDFIYPIATYEETKRDAARALLDALAKAIRGDGISIQFMIRPAAEGWAQKSIDRANNIRKNKGKKSGAGAAALDIMEALWRPPDSKGKETKAEDAQLSSLEQAEVETIEQKTRYPGYETLVRVVVSSSTSARSQALLQSVIASFSLFDSPTYNGFKFTMTSNIDDLITSYIFRFFPQRINNNILNSIELSTLFHLPTRSSIPTEKVQRQRIKQVDGPTEIMDGGLLIGVNEFRGVKKQIRLSEIDRSRHTYIIGQTGMGKSVLLENLAYQDIMNGKGFAFIDPHGDSAEQLIGMIPKERIDDVIYFNPSDLGNPIGMNIFEAHTPEEMDFVIAETNSMLKSLYDPGNTGIVGPRMENIVRNAAILLMSDPSGGTFMDIPKVLIDPDFAKPKIKYLKNQRAIDFWTKEWPASQKSNDAGELTSWVVSKWAPFESGLINNILGQNKSSFNIREVMDGKKILIVNLSKGLMGEQAAKLLGMVFIMKFQAAAMSRADTPEEDRQHFCLYVDEFQNFATDSFESILSEARKYRLNLILANQFMTQLTDKIKSAIIGNVPTKIVGRIGIDDAESLQRAFTPTFTAEDLTKLPNYYAVATVLIGGIPSAPFTMSLVPSIGKSNPELRDALKRYSASKYGRPRALVESDIRSRTKSINREDQKELIQQHQEERAKRIEEIRKRRDQNNKQNVDPLPSIPQQNSTTQNTPTVKLKAILPEQKASFMDGWLEKREQLRANEPIPAARAQSKETVTKLVKSAEKPVSVEIAPVVQKPIIQNKTGRLDVHSGPDEEIVFKIR